MKKLMTALSAAAMALFAHGLVNGDEINHGAGFEAEAYVAGNNFDPAKGDDGESVQTRYWYTASADSDTLVISNYTGETLPAVPDIFAKDSSNAKYLHLDTSSPLFRSAKPNEQSTEFEGVGIGDGIYLDTLVKFTAADTPFEADLTDGDKIAIEYVDQTTDDTIPEEEQIKSFIIRAGRTVGEDFGQDNYFAAAPADFDVSAWHRLTVRSIANVGDGQVGFVIYLDGDVNNPLAYDTSVDAGFGTLDQAVAEKFYNNSLHALYPSAVDSQGTGGSEISAVSFSGTGCIDDVVFTTTTPNFIQQGESVVVSFVADAGVTAISVSVDGEDDPFPVVNGAATLPAQTANFTVNVTVDEANGYTLGGISYNGDPVVNGEVTGYTGGDITITTTRNNFNLFDADGNAITTGAPFQTLSAALAADGVAKIVLAHSYDVAESEGDGFVTYDIDSDITLDLNGNTIAGGGDDALFTVGSGVTMIVIDSAAANTGKIDYTGTYAVFYSEGNVVIGAPTGDNGPTIDGYLAADGDGGDGVWLVKAKIEAATNSDEGEFHWADYMNDGEDIDSEATLVVDYWVVTPKGGSELTEIAVPTAESNLVYDGTEQTGVAAGEGYTLTGVTAATNAGEYTATATPVSGYAWVGGSTDATNITWSIAKVELNAVTVTLDPASATYDSEKDEVTDYTTPSVNFGLGAPELVENTDYTVAWSATEVTGAGTFTYTVSPVADSNYTFTEASATLTITEGGEYPSYIDPTDAEAKKKYDAWKDTYGADTASAYEDAFLLNCSTDAAVVAAEKAAFKFTAIYQDSEGNWVAEMPEKNTQGSDYNGTVTIKRYSDVGCTVESESGNFFKATLD